MVYGELPTVFPWYDDIRKQNRFKRNSEHSCPFRLITPRDALLPFQFRIPYKTNADKSIFDKNNPNNIISNSRVVGSNGTFVIDNEYQRTVHIPIPQATIFIKTRRVMPELLSYYNVSKNFISSVVGTDINTVLTPPANARYIVVNFSKDKDTRASDLLDFFVTNTPSESVLPGDIISWKVFALSGLEIDITNGSNLSKIHKKQYQDGMRIFYYGEKLHFFQDETSIPGEYNTFSIPSGSYYSVLEFDNAIYYSEVFTVPQNRFRLNEPNDFMRVDYWNSSDIAPIMYNPLDGRLWKQYVYIDAFVYASDPEIEVEGERDSDDLIIPTFQRLITKYRFTSLVPDFLKIALVSIQMHDNIELTTERSVRKGKIDRISTDTAIEGDGAYSSVNVIFDQYVMTKKACDKNMPLFDGGLSK